MKSSTRQLLTAISLIIALSMLVTAFAACQAKPQQNSDPITNSTEGTTPEESSESSKADTDIAESKDSSSESESETEINTEKPSDRVDINSNEAPLIEYASSISNGVDFGFSDPTRTALTFSNSEMNLEYALSVDQKQLVKKLTNKSGYTYVENTMDVFVKMTDGSTFYSSNSYISTSANAFRMGYYFYEIKLQDQIFSNDMEISSSKKISHIQWENFRQCTPTVDGKVLKVVNDAEATDAFVSFGRGYTYDTQKYQLLKITMKADSRAANGEIFIIANGETSYKAENSISFNIKNDGEFHDYLIPLSSIAGYKGTLTGLRLDVFGGGASYEISALELVETNTQNAPLNLVLCRSFMTYSDKMHHVIQVAAKEKAENIDCIGMETKISADTVEKLIVKDAGGIKESLDGVDWSTAEYVAFDIKDAGIFGYILPFDGKGGNIKVTVSDGLYTVIQTLSPENNTIIPSEENTLNANDFYMGQRIYTDDSHDFTEFLQEAYCERNPLTSQYVKVSETNSASGASFAGYDSLRGIYKFTLARVSGGFNTPYYKSPNKHYNVDFTIRGDKYDRKIYAMTATESGQLECAVLLDQNDLLLPIPIEVGKNFSETAGDRSIFNLDDAPYSEAIFPLVIAAQQKVTYNIVNLYQRWGNFPLKQLSWIQFQAPYYHLSTGVVETNCILPWSYTPWSCTNTFKGLNTLPDFRPMSAPFWESQPQHTSCGTHTWLVYTDESGSTVTYECTDNTITSYGPVYAEIAMDYISDDGRIKSTYTHLELPQTDENRTYYSMSYEVLEDISFKDFANEFEFYRVTDNDPSGIYQNIGYLNESNECTVTNAVIDEKITNADGSTTINYAPSVKYVLGNNCPYFSLFNMKDNEKSDGYSNLALLIYNSDFVICGEEVTPQFAITHTQNTVRLTLNYDELTLKAGDKFTINCILLPWGSQETVYDGSNGLAPDQSVRNVREDSLLDPIKATPYESASDCTAVESVFLPKLRTNNGKAATFTVSGGSRACDLMMDEGRNNIAVRVYGFDMLTAPMVEELIDGEWIPYAINSYDNPDSANYAHSYDGYGVYYDGDGTFSYAFVIDMTEGKDRTFRLIADTEFKGWPAEPNADNGRSDFLDIYTDPVEIADIMDSTSAKLFTSYTVSDDESYISVFGTNNKAEGYIYAFENNTDETGHFLVLKYRIPTTNQSPIRKFEFFTSTVLERANASCLINCPDSFIEADGEWHVLVIDISKVVEGSGGNAPSGFLSNVFVPASDEKYYATHLRFDFFSQQMSDTDYIDIAYIGMDNSLDEINQFVRDDRIETLTLIQGVKGYDVDTNSGTIVDKSAYNSYVKEGSGYTVSANHYASCLDIISGTQYTGTTRYSDTGKNGVTNITYGKTTTDKNDFSSAGTFLQFSGWAVVQSGVSNLVYSTDGGLTWSDMLDEETTNATSTLIDNGANKRGTPYTFSMENDSTGGNFQGGKLYIDLSEHAGETVNVIIAAAPISAPDTLCVLANIIGVSVPAN